MKFLTREESTPYLETRANSYKESVSVAYPWPGLTGFARMLSQSSDIVTPCLLLITATDIFPSSENLHLYYRLRQSYCDYRFVEDAPGHLFLSHEANDLMSFIQLTMINCWDASLTIFPYSKITFSNDEFVTVETDDVELLKAMSGWKKG